MIQLATYLFIGTNEVMFILVIVIMVFGADKIPEIARGLGKGMRMLRDASSDIKSEIAKSAEQQGLNTEVTKEITEEINKVKDDLEDFSGSVSRKPKF
ncbi:twin-arginine translocase TatA/TatE family subunit [Psychroserpens sp.]|uniref:Sec-independent protein translocase subunit TatA/TatB n=1 Tax=Psychroserpens sp. TaxID=2020870 RepID=UPI001B1C95CF|nr:twin-arginine translocase TatA/TatE family subunit [Psychroserpens sp.]MBO6605935.1 twin-arginine translocase TatA/TatE family subunit [Psychroserpens sp.]MBO6652694.1 twin-arginine translocase TatA/TatE family subunit [Psychroserpens sp.]MBO6681534.1 twin-arginine translocase TatA/TatE family subunit [Psychroserpens sp.]MBO6749309.1 twin-arginine translocase TatA/TatE family subunit [Psychroserpens sp.]MBO6914245.1 twin-arginine translocase TatA/TatE family subunit [Psychroserpens sp.]